MKKSPLDRKKVCLSVAVEPGMLERLQVLAASQKRTVSNLVQVILADALQAAEGEIKF